MQLIIKELLIFKLWSMPKIDLNNTPQVSSHDPYCTIYMDF